MFDAAISFEEERRGQAGLDAAAHNREIWEEGVSGHRKRKGTSQEKWPEPKPNLPPPSIGPVPTLIEYDESLEDWAKQKPQHKTESRAAHFDDPLTEALFGDAPDIDLSGILNESPIDDRGEEDGSEKMYEVETPQTHQNFSPGNRIPPVDQREKQSDFALDTDKKEGQDSERRPMRRRRRGGARQHKRRDFRQNDSTKNQSAPLVQGHHPVGENI